MQTVFVGVGGIGERSEVVLEYRCRRFDYMTDAEVAEDLADGLCEYVPEPPIWMMEVAALVTVAIVVKIRKRAGRDTSGDRIR